MEATKIYSMETLIKALRNFILLNGEQHLGKFDETLKKDYEAQIVAFLNNLENYSKLHSEDAKPNYSLENVSEFIRTGCSHHLSLESSKENLSSQAFTEKLSELMKKKGVKSKDIIEATGINQAVFSKAKVGLRKPSKDLLKVLSKYFKYDLSEFKK